jgi:phospholipid transport system transporter-binding protein
MLALPAVVTHAVAEELASTLKKAVVVGDAPVLVDASALKDFDSSALAVLLECRREAVARGRMFAVEGLPAKLSQLAGLYGVAELVLPVAAAQ